jgi:hypothetical protein
VEETPASWGTELVGLPLFALLAACAEGPLVSLTFASHGAHSLAPRLRVRDLKRRAGIMRALVVVESSFGNSRAVADALADGLLEGLGDAEVRSVGTASTDLAGVELLVVGGPTHAFGMSRDQTRADAVRQGAPAETSGPGIREWLADLEPPARLPVATFDTRVARVRHVPGSAARGAARMLRRRGCVLVARPESFFVVDTMGPLVDGELARAREWGAGVGRNVRAGAERRSPS